MPMHLLPVDCIYLKTKICKPKGFETTIIPVMSFLNMIVFMPLGIALRLFYNETSKQNDRDEMYSRPQSGNQCWLRAWYKATL